VGACGRPCGGPGGPWGGPCGATAVGRASPPG